MNSKLIGYGFDDSNGAACTSTDNMIGACEFQSYVPLQKRGADSESKQKEENNNGKKEGHRALAFVICKACCLIAKSSRGGSS